MAQSNSGKILDTMFYEADTAYIGSRSEVKHYQGCDTEQQQKRLHPLSYILILLFTQNSVFEGVLTSKQYRCLQQEIDTLLNSDEDSVIFYVSYNDKQIYKNELRLKIKPRNIMIS